MKKERFTVLFFLMATLACGKKSPETQTAEAQAALNADTSYQVLFVELGSDRCVPCKMMKPVMKAIEEKYQGQVKVLFHDVWTDAGKPYGKKYGISVIPTQVFLDSTGSEFFRHEGFFAEDEISELLKEHGVKPR